MRTMAAITTGDVALVGRAGQLELMINSLRGRAKPSFVIAGAAGIGKTRMAAEVAKAAGSAGYSLAHVVATRTAASIPFGAFAPLLPLLRAEEGGLVGLLQAATHALLDNTAGDRPLLLVVDDAQLLDEGSATLLHQLAQQDACSLVASVRVPSRVPDSITSLWKEGIAERIDLLPLDEHEVEQLARIVIGGPVSGPTRHWLYETSKGNPLYARELIRGAVEGGSLTEARGVWTLHFPWHAPERLVELVAARLSELAPPTREAVELLALAEPLGFELLESITEPGALEAGEREGLIVARVEGRRSVVGLVHPLYAEVLRQGIGVVRHRRLAHILAEAVIERGMRRHDDLLRVARWQLDSGKRGEAELLLRAASRAREMFDLQLMGRLARAALDAGAGAAAGRLVGEALYSTGRHDEAERFLAEQATRCVSGRACTISSAGWATGHGGWRWSTTRWPRSPIRPPGRCCSARSW
jgi:hypothetical protein